MGTEAFRIVPSRSRNDAAPDRRSSFRRSLPPKGGTRNGTRRGMGGDATREFDATGARRCIDVGGARVMREGVMNAAEAVRRGSLASRVERLFRARPGQWIDVEELMRVGGRLAWRTRVSDARRRLQLEGGVVEWNGDGVASAYRYVPYTPLARDAGTFVPQRRLF